MNYIICPNCGYEYHPAEIFLPNSVIGNITYVDRDDEGHIISTISDTSDYTETYQCDRCSKVFSTTLEMSFTTKSVKTIDFDSDYTTPSK